MLPTPSAAQLAWHDLELGMFVHFDLPIFAGYGDERPAGAPLSPTLFSPASLETDQWMAGARAMGARFAILTAQHASGFCMWPTEAHEYSVRFAPWRGGKGDLVADFVASCRRSAILPGLYCSYRYAPGQKQAWVTGEWPAVSAEHAQYNSTYERMVTELCTRYGALVELWFDGGFPPVEHGGPDIAPILARYQPQAMVAQSPLATLRWSGNEGGTTPYPSWSTLADVLATRRLPGDMRLFLLGQGDAEGEAWVPPECNTTVRTPHDWFWKAQGQQVKPLAHLLGLYYRSVGRGSVLLLNANPNTDGLIPDEDMQRYVEFGTEIGRRFARSVAETHGQGPDIELALGETRVIDHVVIMEDIAQGERVREFVVEAQLDGIFASTSPWFEIYRGTQIGHKHIALIPPLATSRVRLHCTHAVAPPQIRSLAVYNVAGGPESD